MDFCHKLETGEGGSSTFFHQIKEVYSWLEDEKSKQIWKARFCWYMTGENEYLKKVIFQSTPYYTNHEYETVLYAVPS